MKNEKVWRGKHMARLYTKEKLLEIGLASLVVSVALGPIVTYFTVRIHPLEYPEEPPMFVEYWGFPFPWLRQTLWDWPGPENEIIWAGFARDTLFWAFVLFAPVTVTSVVGISFFAKKERCPLCGSTSIEKIPTEWVTSPGMGMNPPMTLTSRYKYRCRECQHKWED